MLFRSNDTSTTEIYTDYYTLSLHDALPISAYRLPRPPILVFKPRNHQGGFWLELAVRHIVVRQRAVEGILARYECDRKIAAQR